MGFRWSNDLPRYIFFGVWMVINLSLFLGFFLSFQLSGQYFYFRLRTLHALAFARGPANVIHFNTALVLLPICRNLISFVRGCCGCFPRGVRALLDKNITMHQWFAWAIVVASIVHTGAHWYNYERLSREVPSEPPEGVRYIPPGALPGNGRVADPVSLCFSTAAGVTGHVMVVVLFLMVTSSVEFVRRSYFEVFWYTHHLFVVYLIALGLHQIQRLLPLQRASNVYLGEGVGPNGTHNPEYCSAHETSTEFAMDPRCSGVHEAQFSAAGPTSFYWYVAPLLIYAIERVIRLASYCMPVVVTRVVEHPSDTYEIQMKRKYFHPEVGQYVFINVPSASILEWHPFTLTSAPEEDYFSVHIRKVGDWTEKVGQLIGVGSDNYLQSWQLPKIFIDGPFGTASEDVFGFQVAMLVGAGIGVTPFAATLKSIWYKLKDKGNMKLKKVYFYWICKDTKAFEWFQDLLKVMDDQILQDGLGNFLEYYIHLTRGWSDRDAKVIMIHDEAGADAVTGLQQKTHFGRPKWDTIFEDISKAHPGQDVGVLFCGPKVLSSELHKQCNRMNQYSDGSRAKFFYNKENF